MVTHGMKLNSLMKHAGKVRALLPGDTNALAKIMLMMILRTIMTKEVSIAH